MRNSNLEKLIYPPPNSVALIVVWLLLLQRKIRAVF